MDFHLRYRGPLASNGGPKDKAAIREYLSPQLEELFATARQLKEARVSWMRIATSIKSGKVELAPAAPGPSVSSSIAAAQRPDASTLFYKFTLGHYTFIPLVTRHHGLVCELDITFLRREEPGAIVNAGGDIDNRLKTLLDALRLPYDSTELGRTTDPGDALNVFCLLEDDVLITRLSLQTGRLLGPLHANGDPHKDTDVELHIHAIVKVTHGMIANLDFL